MFGEFVQATSWLKPNCQNCHLIDDHKSIAKTVWSTSCCQFVIVVGVIAFHFQALVGVVWLVGH